jgi:hypothetical protein
MPIIAAPAIGSPDASLRAIGGPTVINGLSGTSPPAALQAPDPKYSLQDSQVAQYSKSVYSLLVNGVAANQGAGAAGEIAHLNIEGPFRMPPPPAGTAAGAPYAPGANHNDYAASVMASLRSLSGNGKIFQ